MTNKIVKGFLTIMLILLIGELGMNVSYDNSKVKAEGLSRKTTLNKYDQVNIGGSTFTSLSNNKFLSNSNLGNLAWSNAGTTAAAYKNNAIFTAKEKLMISSTALPTKADIGAGNNNTAIAAQIPKLTGNWWLQDVADQSYTRAYVNASNIFNAGRTESYQGEKNHACALKTRSISGGLASSSYNVAGEQYTSIKRYYYGNFKVLRDGYANFVRDDGSVIGGYSFTSTIGTSNLYGAYVDQIVGAGVTVPQNAVIKKKCELSFCKNDDKNKFVRVTGFEGALQSNDNLNQGVGIDEESAPKPCPTTINNAVTAGTRPLATTNFNLFSAYTAPDTSTGTKLESYPASGSGTYNLQVIDDSLKVKLDSAKNNVIDNTTMEAAVAEIGEKAEIKIPYDLSGSNYSNGTVYVSAMIDDQHYKKLTVAAQNGKGYAILDVKDLVEKDSDGKIIPQVLNIKLYQEEITSAGHIDYISEPLNLDINIKLKTNQIIEEDTENKTSTVYGTPLLMKFIAKDEDGNILITEPNSMVFSLSVEGQNYASIEDQTDGSVIITPKKAGLFNLYVNKLEDDNYVTANQLVVPLEIKKKNITITAQSYDKELGDEVPVYALHAGDDDLVAGDTIPIGITPQAVDQTGVPTYTPTNDKLMTVTSPEGAMLSVIENGTASEVIAFKEKYNVSYVSGRLKVIQIQADSSWLDISPPANEDGWNDTDVVIKLSEVAAEKGFTKIVMNENAAASQEIISSTMPITLDNSTSPPKKTTFTFYKDNGGYSSTIDLPRDIKIDKVAPELNASDISITQNTVVTNRNSDVHVTFRTKDKPESGSSGLKNNGVTYSFDGATTPITAASGLYSFIATKNGTYTLTATDKAGNTTHQEVNVHIPKVIHDLTDVNTYPDEKISLAITAEFSDTEKTGRSYQWYRFKDGAAPEPVGSAGTIDAAAGNADIDFPYNKADVSYSGNYACLITDGDGFYTWSSLFELRVINNAPISSLVMIPKDIQLSKASSDSKRAQSDFEITLTSIPDGVEIPQKKFHIQTVPTITLRKENSLHTYVVDLLYQQPDGTFTNYTGGDDVATFFYQSDVPGETPVLSQKIRLISNIEKYHDPGKYSGTLHFTIRYGGESSW